MNQSASGSAPLYSYQIWDRSIRIFHWLNVICILGLTAVGLVLLYNKSIGVSPDGKILLKTIHAYIGYVFVLNLIWRLVWGFVGNKYSRWKTILPFTESYRNSLLAYVQGFKENHAPSYAGHNPVAKLVVTFLFLILVSQAATGLMLAGTDLYLPPFGHEIAEWVTGSGEDHGKLVDLKPGSKESIDPAAYKEMRAFRKPFSMTHKYGFYALLAAVFIHITGIVVTEIKEKNGLVSAMFTGNKVFAKRPVDLDDNENL